METPKRTYQKHKTTVKITVKHQLNTSVGSSFDNLLDEPLYPLYVTVSVNRQFTRFRSRFQGLMTPSTFEEEVSSSINREFLENERHIIEDSIKQFKPELKSEFKLTEWSKYYESGLHGVPEWINFILNRKLSRLLQDIYEWDIDELEVLPSNAFDALSVTSILGIKEADEMLDYYGPLSKLKIYESALKIKHNTAYSFCLWDTKSGYYQQQLNLILDNSSQIVLNKLDHVLNTAAEDQEFTSALRMLSKILS